MADKKMKERKIINIKTKQPIFSEWIKEVIEQNNFATTDIKSAILLWSTEEEGNWANLNIDVKELECFVKALNDELLEYKLEDFMRRRIGDFIKYIEGEE